MNKDFDDDLPPELEDIPEDVLAQTQSSKKTNTAGSGNMTLGDYAQPKPEPTPIVQKEEVKKEEPKKAFAGMKAGFFGNANKPKPKPVEQQPKKEAKSDIIEVKATKKDAKVLDEVQEAMKMNENLIDKKSEWMTPDLLSKIAANPKLTKLFTNPEYMQGITMMQKDPKGAMERFGGNPEFRELLLEFSKIMGSHFDTMGKVAADKEAQEKAAQQPLRDPKAEQYLQDPKVQYLLQYLQKNPRLDFKMVMNSDPELAQKVKYLIDKGYLALQNQ